MKTRFMTKQEANQKGFTLVELVIVMAILAVIASVAIPKYNGILAKSKTDANVANKTIIRQAAELYCAANQSALANIEALVPGYLKEIPTNPENGVKGYTASATYTDGVVVVTVTEL
jgi:prepilin-type N-terminal cleavage/methylation domain-containing protein